MIKRIAEFIFYGNYFIGILAIALSVESSLQLRLPLNSLTYYLLLFSVTVMYYTFAYTGPLNSGKSRNPRSEWYFRYQIFIKWSQRVLLALSILLSIFFIENNFHAILHLPLKYWTVLGVMLLAGLLYYGLLPGSFYRLNLRNTGWFKAIIIGFVWAACANLLSYIVLQIEKGPFFPDPVLLWWLFVKNWMFCNVNAIMFDIKDYADDSNRQLKTFVVRYGLKVTLFVILIPLISIGLVSLLAFTIQRNLGPIPILLNLLPFILLLRLAWSMQRPHTIFYYLVIIDGLIFLKALCGIAGMQFVK